MKLLIKITSLIAVMALSGCATLSKEECLTVNWREIGQTDGANGAEHGRVAEHREACAKHGVKVDLDQYNSGRAVGLRTFCQANSGFARARQGYVYKGICPSDLEPNFIDGYEEGKAIYRLEQKISQLQSKVSNTEAKVKKLKKKLKKKEEAMLADDVTAEERRALYRKVEDLKDDIHDQAYDRGAIDSQVRQLELELEELISRSRYY